MRWRRIDRLLVVVLVAMIAATWTPTAALADGDPGSDVLVNQNLFVAGDARVSIAQQVAIDQMLRSAQRSGVPIRVAIISHPADLGAVTALWNKPHAYARFLGYELSLAYKQRLLVVMPNGFGFYWVGHSTAAGYRSLAGVSIAAGGGGLAAATQAAVARLAAGAGVKLAASKAAGRAVGAAGSHGGPAPGGVASHSGNADAGAASHASATQTPAAKGEGGVPAALFVLLGVAALGVLGIGGVRVLHRRARAAGRAWDWSWPAWSALVRRHRAVSSLAVVAVAGGAFALVNVTGPSSSSAGALADNPYLDPGSTPPARPAPDFTLSDQSGHPVSLRAYRGKVVMLAFTDSECTTICPLTTTAMLDAKRMLGPAGSQVQLLGVDADPKATSIEDVRSYSQLHGMLGQWRFLTGSLSALEHVWREYGVQAAVQRGLITHTPALYVIGPQGRLRRLYLTQQSYSAVSQLGQLLATEASSLLPDHPRVRSHLSYTAIPTIAPAARTTLPTTTGANLRLGPGSSPHLYLFFATWDQEVTSLGGQLDALNRYQSAAAAAKVPKLTAIDEGSVEPSRGALSHFLSQLPGPLSYPVAIDQSGRVADGYGVQSQPWFVLTSSSGRILWYWNVDTQGWLSRTALTADVRAALVHPLTAPSTPAAAQRQLAGSPPALAALHRQAGRLLGSETALAARIHALHGYPIVLNAWASWCGPCRQEFTLFAAASAHDGRQIAFLGADTDDSAGDAHAFLRKHAVSYPSYRTISSQLQTFAPGGLEGLPTTIFINRAGKVTYVHSGQFVSLGTLDADIQQYAAGG
jgi:cytochrome oxidase Cu insertion factor (SCO1/SenC/PrrC family)/thiol-disulfide isomerase/thioredoxin